MTSDTAVRVEPEDISQIHGATASAASEPGKGIQIVYLRIEREDCHMYLCTGGRGDCPRGAFTVGTGRLILLNVTLFFRKIVASPASYVVRDSSGSLLEGGDSGLKTLNLISD